MSSKKQDDLANNPFVALFPNVECAKQYVEATSIGLAESKKLARQQSATETPDVRKKESLPSKQVKKNLINSKDIIVNDFLQRIFLVTVNCGKISFISYVTYYFVFFFMRRFAWFGTIFTI